MRGRRDVSMFTAMTKFVGVVMLFIATFPFPAHADYALNPYNGGQCNQIGTWDQSTATCTLTSDVSQSVRIINSSFLTLDGAGYAIDTSTSNGNGILIQNSSGVTIRNVHVKTFFETDININQSSNITIASSTLDQGWYGIYVFNSPSVTITGSTFMNVAYRSIQTQIAPSLILMHNTISQTPVGIALSTGDDDIISDNIIDGVHTGIDMGSVNNVHVSKNIISNASITGLTLRTPDSLRNIIIGNIFRDNALGVAVYGPSNGGGGVSVGFFWSLFLPQIAFADTNDDNIIFHNTFINNQAQAMVESGAQARFFRLPPEGGNHWDIYDEPSEGCIDTDHDDFCDDPYTVDQYSGVTDSYAMTQIIVTPTCTINCNSNVLFLPGMGGSRLYRPARPDESPNTERRLWESGGDQDAEYLSLDINGKEPMLSSVYTRDPIDEAYAPLAGPNIYKSFIGKMDELKSSGTIIDWATAAYDWRLSLDDILNGGTKTGDNISYTSTSSDPYVLSELMRLASSSRTHKVTIVAHSNGGLLIKALLIARPELAQRIERIIFVDVPQVGTPQAIASLLQGVNQGMPSDTFPLLLSRQAARSFAQNAPVAYNLLPSFDYFTYVDDPVVTFDTVTLPDWVSRYGDTIHSQERLRTFLNSTYQRVNPQSSDIQHPTSANSVLLARAETTHAALDAWVPPAGIQVIQIAGWGIPTTLKSIEYASTTLSIFCQGICTHGLTLTPSTTIDGDGTVVVPSQLWMSTSTGNVRNYWVNLQTYNKSHLASTLNGVLGVDHKSILEVDGLYSFISDTIASTTKSLASYKYLSTEAPPSTGAPTSATPSTHPSPSTSTTIKATTPASPPPQAKSKNKSPAPTTWNSAKQSTSSPMHPRLHTS